ncbi:MAG: hypothetical protein D6E12_17465 [Desulfovibrio sp.]|nr:MAG: hypothetical protein D6E12_17465 [Desulfovibrio sp.]
MLRSLLVGCFVAAMLTTACGPTRTPEQERAREAIIKYCQILPEHSPERCECMVDRLERELAEEEFQSLGESLQGLEDMQDPNSLLSAVGGMLQSLAGAGDKLQRAFNEAGRECPQ